MVNMTDEVMRTNPNIHNLPILVINFFINIDLLFTASELFTSFYVIHCFLKNKYGPPPFLKGRAKPLLKPSSYPWLSLQKL